MAASKKTENKRELVHPIGALIGEGVEATNVDGVDYKVDPETGRITGPA